MPGLNACGRRWEIGSDDFVYPALGEIIVRVIWLLGIAIVFSLHTSNLQTCSTGHLVQIYYVGILVLLAVHLTVDLFIVLLSSRGTILHSSPRRRLPAVLYVKFLLFVPELVWTILGTYWAFTHAASCDLAVVWVVRVATLIGWLLVIALGISMVVVFDPLRAYVKRRTSSNESVAKELWKTRMKLLCCCAGTDAQSSNAFEDIADIFSDYFQGLDIVPTDIAAGLLLLQMEQQKQPKRMQHVPFIYLDDHQGAHGASLTSTPDSEILTPMLEPDLLIDMPARPLGGRDTVYPHPKSWMTLENAAHFRKFALSIYGWPFYMYSNLMTGGCKLSPGCKCCSCMSPASNVVGDNCCGCNLSAILKINDIKEDDIIYASFCNKVYEIPFFVALDHRQRTVVIAIRGTLSFKDALTDLTAACEELPVDGVEGGVAHKGILQAAKYIYSSLLNLHLIETALQTAPDYRVMVTGHSLGAGAAAILAILLRPMYPKLICFAYSPPGWLLSMPLARYTEDFVCSVIIGKDLASRLGLVTLAHLKAQVLQVVRNCNRPKYRILAGGAWNLIFGPRSLQRDEEMGSNHCLLDNTTPKSYSSTEPEQQQIELSLDEAILRSSRSHLAHTALYMPGHILYIDEEEPASTICGTPSYHASWARTEVFDEILVSPKMVTDHLPHTGTKALDQLVKNKAIPSSIVQLHSSNPMV